jgi:competence CoiA-like predicted nuclease
MSVPAWHFWSALTMYDILKQNRTVAIKHFLNNFKQTVQQMFAYMGLSWGFV